MRWIPVALTALALTTGCDAVKGLASDEAATPEPDEELKPAPKPTFDKVWKIGPARAKSWVSAEGRSPSASSRPPRAPRWSSATTR